MGIHKIILVLAELLVSTTAVTGVHPNAKNPPLVFISNPVETNFPGHWIPADLLKAMLEKSTKVTRKPAKPPPKYTLLKWEQSLPTPISTETELPPPKQGVTRSEAPVTEESSSKESTTEESSSKESTTEESSSKESTTEEYTTKKSFIEESSTKEPTAGESTAKEPTTKEPSTPDSEVSDGYNGR